MTKQQAELIDYEFQSQYYERRVQYLIDWQWEDFAQLGHITARSYVIAVSYE